MESRAAVQRWRRGQMAAERRQAELMAIEGPNNAQAVAEALAALTALEAMGRWPGPRDPLAERRIAEVRRRWAKIQTNARRLLR